MNEKKIRLEEHITDNSIDFILGLYPLNKNDFDYNLTYEISKFLGDNDYKKYREIRDQLIWNKLIEHSKNEYPKNEFYKLTDKGVEFIKQENLKYKDNFK